ncbi:MAG: hypothetical protein ACFE0O_07350 [Opitutales bacterium]
MLRPSLPILACALAGMTVLPEASAQGPTDYQDRPAVFQVTADVVNPNLEPFTLTAPAFGNTLKRGGKGGFEPATFRTLLYADTDAADRVVNADSAGIHHYDSYQSGYLDGAAVRVYRPVNGEMHLVREDTVVPDGTVIEYWHFNQNKVLPPDTTRAEFQWADWSRPGAERWFTVFAVDRAGNRSPAATPVRLKRSQAAEGAQARNREIRFAPRTDKAGEDSEPPDAPAGFQASVRDDGIVVLSWDPVDADDLAGYQLARTDTDPAGHRGIYLQLAGDPEDPQQHILTGDMVIVSKSMRTFNPGWLSHRLGNLGRRIRDFIPYGVPTSLHLHTEGDRYWKLVPHPEDTPVDEPGETYLEIRLPRGETALVGHHGTPDISTTDQDFYPVPKDGADYVMEVWIRAEEPDADPVVFTWEGDDRVGAFVGRHPLAVSTEWKQFKVRFTGQSADEGFHARLVLETTGPGTFHFDNFRVYRADTPYLDYFPRQYAQLERSGMMALRTHGPIKTGTNTYSMRQFLGAPGSTEGIHLGNTLPQALDMMERAGLYPWLQIEFHMSPEEWRAFAEYMAAPYDPAVDSAETRPFAHLRHSQGRTAPWTEAFDRIYFELSNETWNWMFRPWIFEKMEDRGTGNVLGRGEVYGMFHDHVVEQLRSSPYWTDAVDARFIHVLGGWFHQNYSEEAVRGSDTGDFVTIAAYNGGWDEGEGTPRPNPPSFFNVLSQVNQTAIPRARDQAAMALAFHRQGRLIRLGTYEAGPGYAHSGLGGAGQLTDEQYDQQEAVMKSKLAGTATLDSFLARAYYGFDLQNFFTFAEGNLWKSHAQPYRGSAPHASYLPLELFNKFATGDLLRTKTRSVPTVDTPAFKRRKAIDDQPLAAVYATRAGDRVSLFCISRKVAGYPDPSDDGHTVFGVELPFNRAESITRYRLSGEPEDTNIDAPVVTIESESIDPAQLRENGQFIIHPPTGGGAQGLPPAETFLYVFEGTNIGSGDPVPLDAVLDEPTTFQPPETAP